MNTQLKYPNNPKNKSIYNDAIDYLNNNNDDDMRIAICRMSLKSICKELTVKELYEVAFNKGVLKLQHIPECYRTEEMLNNVIKNIPLYSSAGSLDTETKETSETETISASGEDSFSLSVSDLS